MSGNQGPCAIADRENRCFHALQTRRKGCVFHTQNHEIARIELFSGLSDPVKLISLIATFTDDPETSILIKLRE